MQQNVEREVHLSSETVKKREGGGEMPCGLKRVGGNKKIKRERKKRRDQFQHSLRSQGGRAEGGRSSAIATKGTKRQLADQQHDLMNCGGGSKEIRG